MNNLATFITIFAVAAVSAAIGWHTGGSDRQNIIVHECVQQGVYTDRNLIVECKVYRPQQKERV